MLNFCSYKITEYWYYPFFVYFSLSPSHPLYMQLPLSSPTLILHPSRPLNCVFAVTISLSLSLSSLPLFLAKFLTHNSQARTISHTLSLLSLAACASFSISISVSPPQLCMRATIPLSFSPPLFARRVFDCLLAKSPNLVFLTCALSLTRAYDLSHTLSDSFSQYLSVTLVFSLPLSLLSSSPLSLFVYLSVCLPPKKFKPNSYPWKHHPCSDSSNDYICNK